MVKAKIYSLRNGTEQEWSNAAFAGYNMYGESIIAGIKLKTDSGSLSSTENQYVEYDLKNNRILLTFYYGMEVLSGSNSYDDTFYLSVNGDVLLNNVRVNGSTTKVYTVSKTINCNADGSAPNIYIVAGMGLIGTDTDKNFYTHAIRNGKIKKNNSWKNAFAWLKTNSGWKRCIIWKKINGTWKKGKAN